MNIENIRAELEEAFSQLNFEEVSHTYKLGDKFLPSVTRKLSRFYDCFDANKVVVNYAKKWNRENQNNQKTEQEILDEWDTISKEASDKGTLIHSFTDNYPEFPEPEFDQQRGILEFFRDLPSNYVVVAIELKMHNEVFAGTTDVILYNIKTGKLVLVDWKTNKDLFKNFKGKKLLSPFNTLLDNPINKYKIQLNHYKILIEDMTRFEIEDMWIVWLTQEEPNLKAKKTNSNYMLFDAPNWTKKIKKYYVNFEINL